MKTITKPAPPSSQAVAALEKELRSFWTAERSDWDQIVDEGGPRKPLAGGADLWAGMPAVDSKAVARTSPIFERHLGVELDVKLIRPGGYSNIDEVVKQLIPAMVKVAAEKTK
jgi:hypothetical protein